MKAFRARKAGLIHPTDTKFSHIHQAAGLRLGVRLKGEDENAESVDEKLQEGQAILQEVAGLIKQGLIALKLIPLDQYSWLQQSAWGFSGA